MKYTNISLKVLKGHHLDALISIEKSRIFIGGGEENDVILQDLDAKKHLEFIIRDKGMFIKPLDAPVLLDGIELSVPSIYVRYKPYQLIDFKSCSIAIGPADGKWPKASTNSKEINDLPNKQKSFYKSTIIALGLLAFLAVIISIYFSINTSHMQGDNLSKTSLPHKIRLLIDDKGFHDIKIEKGLNGRIHLVGKVSDVKAKEELAITVNTVTSRFSTNISVLKSVEEEAKAVLHSYGMIHTDLSLVDNVLVIKGYTDGDWTKVKSSLLQDMPSITSIDDYFLSTSEGRLQTFSQMLGNKGLEEKVELNVEEGIIISSGELTSSDMKLWGDIKREFIELYSVVPKVKDNVINISEKLKLSIQSVSIGKSRYFVSENGKKYLVGADLGNGYIVNSIEIDQVILKYKGNMIPVKYFRDDELPSEEIKIYL